MVIDQLQAIIAILQFVIVNVIDQVHAMFEIDHIDLIVTVLIDAMFVIDQIQVIKVLDTVGLT
jgi:hypothetical protein